MDCGVWIWSTEPSIAEHKNLEDAAANLQDPATLRPCLAWTGGVKVWLHWLHWLAVGGILGAARVPA